MKIRERSANRLHLSHFSWYYGAIAAVFGLLCLYAALNLFADGKLRDAAVFFFLGCGASLGLGALATRAHSVLLDRSTNLVSVRNRTIFGRTLRKAPLSALTQANMQTSNTGDLALHRLVLLFDDRDGWVVTKMYTSGDGAIRALEQINSWLAETTTE